MLRLSVLVALLGAVVVHAAGTWSVANMNLATIAAGVAFTTPQNGFIPVSDNGQGSLVLGTTDGGKTFNPLPAAGPVLLYLGAAAQGNSGVTSDTLGLQFSDVASAASPYNFSTSLAPDLISQNVEAFASTFYGATGQTIFGDNGVAVSADNGAVFAMVNVTVLEASARYGAFPSATTWFLSAGDFPTNNSASFDPSVRHLTKRIRVGQRPTGESFFEILPRSAANDASGWDAQIVKTTDGGKTWKSVFYNAGNYYFNQIDCSSETHCAAAAEADSSAQPGVRILVTFDGGDNWTQTYFDANPDESVFALKFLSDSEIYVGGCDLSTFTGHFYHSIDGGKTWAVESLAGVYPNAFSFPTSSVGFATAFNYLDQSAFLTYA